MTSRSRAPTGPCWLRLGQPDCSTPHLDKPENGFSFGMALSWTDPSAAEPLFWMGEVTAEHVGQSEHLGFVADEYRLTGLGFRD